MRSSRAVENALRRAYKNTRSKQTQVLLRRCSPWQSRQQGRLLEKAEQFEHDYDNDNYSDYVEDASVHAMG
jgi:hypothetical protein